MEPRVGVVILTYNRLEILRSCLHSILESEYQNHAMVVVDNASSDGTSEAIVSQFPSVKLIRSEENLGYTGGNNLGMEYVLQKENCDYLLILNDDTIVTSNLLGELVSVLEENSKIGISNPKILDFETQNVMCNYYGEYNFYLGVGHKPLLSKSSPEEIGLIRGTCFLLRKEVLKKIGLMDENFFLYFDEADLSYRIKKAGFKMAYVPTAIAYHQISHSFSGATNPVVLYYSTRNELLFAKKHLNILMFLPVWMFRFILRMIKYVVETRNLNVAGAMSRGLIDFTRGNFGRWKNP